MTAEIPEVMHPVRGDALTPLEHQLWRFRMVAVEVQALVRGLYSVEDVAATIPEPLLFSLTNQAILLVAKFLEVWSDFGTLAKGNADVVRARRVVAPITRRLEVWTGLTEFRNTTLAHPYETKDGKLVGPWFLMSQHRVPTFHAEAILLLHCVNLAVATVLAVFGAQYAPLGPSLRSSFPSPEAGPGITRGEDVQPAVDSLTEELGQRLIADGLPTASPVYAEFREATRPRRK